MDGPHWGEGSVARGLAVKLSPQPRRTAPSPVCSPQITGDWDQTDYGASLIYRGCTSQNATKYQNYNRTSHLLPAYIILTPCVSLRSNFSFSSATAVLTIRQKWFKYAVSRHPADASSLPQTLVQQHQLSLAKLDVTPQKAALLAR